MVTEKPLPGWVVFLTPFVLSLAMLGYEILLTRIASVLLTSQYVFLVLGISLLGISAGAVIEHFLAGRSSNVQAGSPGLWLAWASALLLFALVVILKLGDRQGIVTLTLATALPFVASGFIFSRLFREYLQLSGVLYAADLLGAAAGAFMVPILLPALGPIRAILLLAVFMAAVASLMSLLASKSWHRMVAISMLLLMASLFYGQAKTQFLGKVPIGQSMDKDFYRLTTLNQRPAEIVASRWSTFGRTDLVRFKDDSSMMAIFIDGAAGTNMLRFNGQFNDTSASFQQATVKFSGMVPLLNLKDEQKEHALIIGPGGGRDVLLALKAGFRKITAVEVNPQMVKLVKDYHDFNGGIYSDYENVEVVVAEGRQYLHQSREKYDLIMLYMPITKSSRSLNAFALTENYLFTREAFREYYDHLTEQGSLLVMAHGMPEVYKILTTSLRALQEKDLPTLKAMEHIYILGSPMMPLLGLKKAPVQTDEAEFLHAAVHYTAFDCKYSYIPGVEQQLLRLPLSTSIDAYVPMMNELFLNLAKGKLSLERLETGTNLNLMATSDDRPFFFHYSFDLPGSVSTVFWLSLFALMSILLFSANFFRSHSDGESDGLSWHLLLYFVMIGTGYIMIEMVLFQILVFYLGDPARSLAILLAGLLIGSGAGSYASRNAGEKIALKAGILSSILALGLWFLIPVLFEKYFSISMGMKQFFAAGLLVLQGLPMGVMFPTGLRLSGKLLGKDAIPWMWAINGSASVAGSALSVAIAMLRGYTASLFVAATLYVIAAGFLKFIELQKARVDVI